MTTQAPVHSDAAAPLWPAARFVGRLSDPAARRRFYALIAAGFFLLSWVALAAKSRQNHVPLDLVVSDAEGYWAYLPSLAVYGNLDFTESIRYHAKFHPLDFDEFPRVGHRLKNRWPLGVALTLSPAFFIAHGVSLLLYRVTGSHWVTPDGYSIVYQFCCLVLAMGVGYVGLLLADDLLVRRFSVSGPSAALGIACYWVGSNYGYYYFREPFLAHMISASWAIAAVWLIDRIANGLPQGQVVWWEWLLLSFAASVAVMCRFTDAVLLAPAAYLAWEVVRSGQIFRVLKVLPVAIFGLAPIFAQLGIWRLTVLPVAPVNRSVKLIGYSSREGFHWLRPALPQTLFSPDHGLFLWSPILLLSVWGLVWRLRQPAGRRDGLLVSVLIAGLSLWYLNSAWYAWTFGEPFGARAFVDFAVLFLIGMGLAFQWVSTLTPGRQKAVFSGVVLCIIFNWALMFLYMTHRISREGTPWSSGWYGNGRPLPTTDFPVAGN